MKKLLMLGCLISGSVYACEDPSGAEDVDMVATLAPVSLDTRISLDRVRLEGVLEHIINARHKMPRNDYLAKAEKILRHAIKALLRSQTREKTKGE